jgi:autotransporter family porin
MWMRNMGGNSQFTMNDGQNKTTANRYILQVGGDIAQWSSDGLNRLHLGVMGGYANQHSSTKNNLTGYRSKGSVNGYSMGFTALGTGTMQTRRGCMQIPGRCTTGLIMMLKVMV